MSVNVIHVRHELDEAAQRLLKAIGWTYVVSPDAPECERYIGYDMQPSPCRKCKAVSA